MAEVNPNLVTVDRVKSEDVSVGRTRTQSEPPPTYDASSFFGTKQPFASVQQGGTWYTQYLIDTEYETDSGLMEMATADGVEVVRLNAPITRKRVKWTAERNNEWPACPSTDTQNSNEVLLNKLVVPANPLQSLGNVAHRVSGRYTYVMLQSLGETGKMPAGTTPAEVAKSSDHTLNGAAFDKAIISASHVK